MVINEIYGPDKVRLIAQISQAIIRCGRQSGAMLFDQTLVNKTQRKQ